MPHNAQMKALVDAEVKGLILPHGPVVTLDDPDWDNTVVDCSDPEYLTLSQIDDSGVSHTVLLSQKMLSQLRPYLLRWITSNTDHDYRHP